MVSGRSPSARASSNASATPFLNASPVRLAGPVNGPNEPILSGSPVSCACRRPGLATRNAAAPPAAPAVSRKRRRDTAEAGVIRRRAGFALRCFIAVLPLTSRASAAPNARPDRRLSLPAHHERPLGQASMGAPRADQGGPCGPGPRPLVANDPPGARSHGALARIGAPGAPRLQPHVVQGLTRCWKATLAA